MCRYSHDLYGDNSLDTGFVSAVRSRGYNTSFLDAKLEQIEVFSFWESVFIRRYCNLHLVGPHCFGP